MIDTKTSSFTRTAALCVGTFPLARKLRSRTGALALLLALACAFANPVRAHEGEEEDKSPIPVTLGATWQAVLKKQAELQGATASQSLPMIHKLAFRMRDLCNTLPQKSRGLPPEKLARVTGAAKNIAKLAEELDKTGDAKDQSGTEANLKKLDGLLKLLAGQYDPVVLADISKEPPPDEAASKAKEHAHSDHESKRGGVLMMLGDYHIEGVQVDDTFRVYFFNEYTRPIPVSKITGKLVLPLPSDAKPDAEEPRLPLQPSKDGMFLFAERPANYPEDYLTVRLLIEGRETPFGFPIFKTSEANCGGCGIKTIAGLQAVSACGMCIGKLTPKDGKINCTKCAMPVSYKLPSSGRRISPSGSDPAKPDQQTDTVGLKGVLEEYHGVQTALAADDLKQAQTGAKELADASEKAAADSKALAKISRSAQAIHEAKDLGEARKAFGDVSLALIDQLGQTPKVGAKYYVFHCPMAKVGNGDWIQSTPTTSNPYFGKEMLRCGSLKQEGK